MTTSNTDFGPCDPVRITDLLRQLVRVTGCPARIGSLRREGVVYFEVTPGGPSPRLAACATPAHRVASGQVMLAHSSDSDAENVLSRELQSSELTSPMARAEVAQVLSLVRLSGVAVVPTPAPGNTLGVAVPVRRSDGGVCAALEVDVRNLDHAESLLDDLTATSDRLSRAAAGA